MTREGRFLNPGVKQSVGVILMLSAAVAVGVAMHRIVASAWLLAWGLGPLAVGFDASASSGKRTFGWVFGGLFTLLGVIALRFAIRSQLRKRGRASP